MKLDKKILMYETNGNYLANSEINGEVSRQNGARKNERKKNERIKNNKDDHNYFHLFENELCVSVEHGRPL